MSDKHVHGGLIDQSQLDKAGHPLPAGVDLPAVDRFTLDDDDAGNCRLVTEDEIRGEYLDNPTQASPVQPEWLTLEIDNQPITFTYANGAQYTTPLGSIDWTAHIGADRFRKVGGIVYPVDASGNVMLNRATTPRLVNVREYLHEQIQQRSEERVEMAWLVNAFASIMSMNSGLDGIKTGKVVRHPGIENP